MAIREIAPLDDEEWDELYNSLEAGQTEAEAKFLKEALENKNNIRVVRD